MDKIVIEIPCPTNFVYQLAKAKAANAARIYLPLREYNTRQGGSGSITISDATKLLCHDPEWKIANSIKPLLKKWDGVFWRLTDIWILLLSPSVVADNLGIESPNGHVTFLDINYFKNIKSIKAAFYGCAPNKISTPISRAKLQELTGVSESTQKTYLKEIDLPYVLNYAIYERNGVPVEWHPQLQKYLEQWRNCFPKKVGDRYCLATTLPAEYRSIFRTGFRRRLRMNRSGRSKNYGTGIKQKFTRVFYGHKENDDDIPDNQSIKFYSKHNNAEEQEQIKSSFLYEIFGDSLLCNERAWRAILPYELDWESVMNQSYY